MKYEWVAWIEEVSERCASCTTPRINTNLVKEVTTNRRSIWSFNWFFFIMVCVVAQEKTCYAVTLSTFSSSQHLNQIEKLWSLNEANATSKCFVNISNLSRNAINKHVSIKEIYSTVKCSYVVLYICFLVLYGMKITFEPYVPDIFLKTTKYVVNLMVRVFS